MERIMRRAEREQKGAGTEEEERDDRKFTLGEEKGVMEESNSHNVLTLGA